MKVDDAVASRMVRSFCGSVGEQVVLGVLTKISDEPRSARQVGQRNPNDIKAKETYRRSLRVFYESSLG